MIHYTKAPYFSIFPNNVFANNIIKTNGIYRLWRYVFDYEVEQPRLEAIPVKRKDTKGLSLFRYMRAPFFFKDLSDSKLTFLSPTLWEDPFEKLFYKEQGLCIGDNTYYVECICLTYDWIESEEAAWKRSGDIGDTIRVEYDFDLLCEELSRHDSYSFYFSVIDYSLPREDIVRMSRMSHQLTSIGDYLNLLSLKRKAFLYENEIRLFIVSKTPFPDNLFKIKYNNSPIKTVCFPPQKSDTLSVMEKKIINTGINVLHSRLYDIN